MASSDEEGPTGNSLGEDMETGFDDVDEDEAGASGAAFLQELESSTGDLESHTPEAISSLDPDAHHPRREDTTSLEASKVSPSPHSRKRDTTDQDETVESPLKKQPNSPTSVLAFAGFPRNKDIKTAIQTFVTDPKVVGNGTGDKHVVYRIETIVNDANLAQMSFDGHSTFSVHRRFSDFAWLRETLESQYLGFIIPPLPDKTVPLLQNNLSERFFLSRARGLNKFLTHVVTHAYLSRDNALKDFLIAEQERFESLRKPALSVDANAPAAVQAVSHATVGLFEKMADWGSTLSSQLGNALSGATRAGAQRREREPMDDHFDEAQRYITDLEPRIQFVHETARQLIEKNQYMSKALHDLGLAFTSMGQSEQQNPLSEAITELGNVCNGRDGLSVLVNLQVEAEQVKFLEPIDDYVRLIAAAKHALQVRNQTAHAYESALGDLCLKQDARNKMTPDDSKITAADTEISKAQIKAENAKKDFDMVTDRVLKEIERFKREKSRDFKELILHYVQLQIEHNQAVELLWKTVLPKLGRVSESSFPPQPPADDV